MKNISESLKYTAGTRLMLPLQTYRDSLIKYAPTVQNSSANEDWPRREAV
jgi:hypothetical protein